MKTKLIFSILLLAFFFSCNAQLNQLTSDELFEIKFDNFSLGDIMEIQGQDTKAEDLFGEGNFESGIN